MAVTVDMEVEVETDRRETMLLGPIRTRRGEGDARDEDGGEGSIDLDVKSRVDEDEEEGWSHVTAFEGTRLKKDGGVPPSLLPDDDRKG